MTTDNFTEAELTDYARAEAETRWPQRRTGHYVQQLAFVAGAEWARTHLAAQEPTDAEVEAAKAVLDSVEYADEPQSIRAALSAARAALRARNETVERRAVALFTDSESWRFAYATQATSWDDLDASSKEMFRNLARRDEEAR